jgi:hypothetical protein
MRDIQIRRPAQRGTEGKPMTVRFCAGIFAIMSCLVLTACNEVTGNERGGIIAGAPTSHDRFTDWVSQNVIVLFFDEDALQKANAHCSLYGKRARITSVAGGKTLFECL